MTTQATANAIQDDLDLEYVSKEFGQMPTIDDDGFDSLLRAPGTDTERFIRGIVTYIKRYRGPFERLCSIRDQPFGHLTKRQLRLAFNCLTGDVRRTTEHQRKEAEVTKVPEKPVETVESVLEAVPDGYYTVLLDGGKHVTFHLAWSKRAQRQAVELLIRPEEYLGFAWVTGVTYQLWRRSNFNEMTPAVKALRILLSGKWRDAGREYAMESGVCFVCRRMLSTPESISLGIGPICAENTGF